MTAEREIELKPCPFCSGSHVAVVTFEALHYEVWYRAECQSCMAKSPGSKYSALAIAAWNRRSPPERDGELAEVLRRVDHTLSLHGKVDADTDLHEFIRAILAKHFPESK